MTNDILDDITNLLSSESTPTPNPSVHITNEQTVNQSVPADDTDAIIAQMGAQYGIDVSRFTSQQTTQTITTPSDDTNESSSFPWDEDYDPNDEDYEDDEDDDEEDDDTDVEYNEDTENTTISVQHTPFILNEEVSRFSGAEWFNEVTTKQITLVGAGGIGSHTAFSLGRLGINRMYIFDNDVVGPENLSGQIYSRQDISKYKVNALANILYRSTTIRSVVTCPNLFNSATAARLGDKAILDIMICGLDNMEARKTCFTIWRQHMNGYTPEQRANCLFIDGRLAMEEFQVFCIPGDSESRIIRYQNDWLFNSTEAEETVCSRKQTSFMASHIGATITSVFVNWCASRIDSAAIRDVPFFISYNAPLMFLKTES